MVVVVSVLEIFATRAASELLLVQELEEHPMWFVKLNLLSTPRTEIVRPLPDLDAIFAEKHFAASARLHVSDHVFVFDAACETLIEGLVRT